MTEGRFLELLSVLAQILDVEIASLAAEPVTNAATAEIAWLERIYSLPDERQ